MNMEIALILAHCCLLLPDFSDPEAEDIPMVSILLIIEGCSMVKQTIWPSNHKSHTKVYFNEFVANVLRDNIGIVNFDL